MVLEPKYPKIQAFRNGHAKVRVGEFWGLIDKSGKIIIEPIYQGLGVFSEGIITAKKDEVHGIIHNGNFTKVEGTLKIWDFRNGEELIYANDKDKKIGFINRKGEWVIEPQYKKVRAFSNGLAPVTTNGKQWGYINEKGEMVIPEKFRDAELFSKDGLAPVKVSKLWGFINKTGDMVIEDKYAISTFTMFSKGASKGFVDGMARVGLKKKWGFIDIKGNLLKDTWYNRAEPFVEIK